MDPNGGMNPSPPRLDNQAPDAPTDIYAQPTGGGSIPPEMPAAAPVFSDPMQPSPQLTPEMPPLDSMQPTAPQPPSEWPQQSMMTPDPMMQAQPMMETPIQTGTGGSKRILFIALGALVAIGILAGVGLAGYSAGKNAGKKEALAQFQQQAAQEEVPTEEPVEEEIQLDLSDVVSRNNVEEEVLVGEIKEPISTSDGIALAVKDIERNYSVQDSNYSLDDDKELLKVNFVIGNRQEGSDLVVDGFKTFHVEAGDTKILPIDIADYPGKFTEMKLKTGEQQSASIIFEIPKATKKLVFVREQEYTISNQNTKKTTRVEINLL